ncbi:MAG: SPOR domain-containing protein [Chitinophagaceae bacterium]
MKRILVVILVLMMKTALAQENTTTVISNQTTAVVVHKDPRVDMLVKKQSSINTAVKKASVRSMRGYRLMVINTNKRNEAIDAKAKIYTYFPDLKAYLSYQSPYFKLKAGNFKTRDEAERYRKMMATMFPKGVFIINDIIEIKPEKDIEESDN